MTAPFFKMHHGACVEELISAGCLWWGCLSFIGVSGVSVQCCVNRVSLLVLGWLGYPVSSSLFMRDVGHVARMGEDRGVHRVLVGKPEGKRPLGRPRRRWEDNIKMDLEVGGGRGDWMELAQDRDGWRSLVGTVRNFRVP